MQSDVVTALFDDEVVTPQSPAGLAETERSTTTEGVGVIDQDAGKNWTMYRGDCCQVIKGLPDASIDLCIHSPPFANLYVYSDSEADMGNCESEEAFIEHYKFLIRELYRVTVPGRLCVVHCKDLPAYFGRDEFSGLIDFPGMIVEAFRECGWQYHSRVTIWKCPVIERARTNGYGLLHNQLSKDSTASRQGMADFLVVFRKWDNLTPADFPKPVNFPEGNNLGDGKRYRFQSYCGSLPPGSNFRFELREEGDALYEMLIDENNNRLWEQRDYSIQVWQRYASPVWFDINQTDVLNDAGAKSDRDERHICPLQLPVIRRAVHLWSNPDDVVLSPFAGIGSEGVGSLELGRKFVGIELKDSYFAKACSNLRIEESKTYQRKLF